MNIWQRFEENLEYLGFDLAPVAWDLAMFPFEDENDRVTVLKQLAGQQDGN